MHEKATAQEVKEQLEANEYITKATIAENLDVSKATIRNKLRILREDGEPIIFGSNGLSLLTKEAVEDPARAGELVKYQDWILGTVKAMVTGATTIKPLLPTLKKTIMLNTTIEERRLIKQNCARTLTLITMAEAEEDMR